MIWGGEFGRTPVRPERRRPRPQQQGLHHLDGRRRREGRAWPTARPTSYGYEAVENKVHVHDWHATILHLLGLDHEKLTYRYAGRDMRLTDVKGNVVQGDPRVVPSGRATFPPWMRGEGSDAAQRRPRRARHRRGGARPCGRSCATRTDPPPKVTGPTASEAGEDSARCCPFSGHGDGARTSPRPGHLPMACRYDANVA